MIDKLENLVRECKRASDAIKFFPGDIRIVSHYDADGITSAAILVSTLNREGKGFHLTMIKQLGEERMKEVLEGNPGFVLFLDFGSGQLDLLEKHLKGSQVVILDHHQSQGDLKALGERAKQVIQVNPMDFGIEENISASGIAYIVARAMNPDNRDLSELAIIGAIGDSQVGAIGPQWGVMGINKEILKDAMMSQKIRLMKGLRLWGRYTRPIHKALEYSVDPLIPEISGSESAAVQFLQELNIPLKDKAGDWRTLAGLAEEEQKKLATGIIAERIRGRQENPEWIFGDVYELLSKEGGFRDANEFATMLNATGKLGRGYLGIALCLNDKNAQEKVKSTLEKYRRTLGSAINWIYTNKDASTETDKAIYVLAGNNISEHIVSNAISTISRSSDSRKPILGFVDAEDGVKVSARASDEAVKDGVNLKEILSKASERVGGQGGGHSGAAGATIPRGREPEFIKFVEALLGGNPENLVITPKEPEKPAGGFGRSGLLQKAEASKRPEKLINKPELNKGISSGVGNGNAERGQESGTEGAGDSGKAQAEEVSQGQKNSSQEGDPGKKVEGKGLVRYIKP